MILIASLESQNRFLERCFMAAATPSYWCYRCSRFVRVWNRDIVVCPDCDGGFVEEITEDGNGGGGNLRRREVHDGGPSPPPFRSRRHRGGERSRFNPVIVLRGGEVGAADGERTNANNFELYYDDGAGSGLRPLPTSMSDFLMGTGFDRLVNQLARIEINGVGRYEQSPASKAAVESMPTVEIAAGHVSSDSHCAVCKEAFELGSEARELPCKHIYHSECILPWMSLRNSCPLCRYELPTDTPRRSLSPSPDGQQQQGAAVAAAVEEETVGLTIWRLPRGGFAVGRLAGGRRAGERELPVVYTEVDGGFNAGGPPRRISWTSRGSRSRENGGIGRAFQSFFSFFNRLRPSSSSSSSSSTRTRSTSSRSSRRRSSSWMVEDDDGVARW